MRKTLCAAALISIALLGAGCKSGPNLAGKWTATVGSGTLDFEFKPDNTFTIGTKLGQLAMTEKGDYKLDGEKLTLTPKDIEAPGLPPAIIEQAKKDPKFAKPQEVTVKFVSADEASLSGLPGGPGGASTQSVTMKRVKEGS